MNDMIPNTKDQENYFQIQRHGDIAVVTPSPEIEKLPSNLIEPAAQIVIAPLKKDPPTSLIIDLSGVNYFGSEFISFLLRCHLLVKNHGSELVICGASEPIRELLHQTALDNLWAIYPNRTEALRFLGGSD